MRFYIQEGSIVQAFNFLVLKLPMQYEPSHSLLKASLEHDHHEHLNVISYRPFSFFRALLFIEAYKSHAHYSC